MDKSLFNKLSRNLCIRVNTTPNSPRKPVKIVEGYRKVGKMKTKILSLVDIAIDDS